MFDIRRFTGMEMIELGADYASTPAARDAAGATAGQAGMNGSSCCYRKWSLRNKLVLYVVTSNTSSGSGSGPGLIYSYYKLV